MSGIGAALPPHLLAKRKRQQEEESENAPGTASGAKQQRSASPDDASEKRRKVAGPAMPPAPLDERPTEPADGTGQEEDESSSDDDDFGPSLPPAGGAAAATATMPTLGQTPARQSEESTMSKPRRDDWMTMPPEQDGLASRMDPSKPRARGFNTGKGAKAPAEKGGDNSSWHETPEQKRKRLEDEMMGVARPEPAAKKPESKKQSRDEEASQKELKERTAKSRGPSLMEQHQSRKSEADGQSKKEEDDPSSRSFDREKDMSIGGVSRGQRKDMLKQAGGFSSKFSGGGYL